MGIKEKLEFAVDYAMHFIGWKYVWGGNDAHAGGLDCSGLVLECLRSVGLWDRSDNTSRGIFTSLIGKSSIEQEARKGDILFFGKSRTEITHVSFALNNWQMVEAGGGDSKSKSGMVRIRPISWRSDLVAIVRPK